MARSDFDELKARARDAGNALVCHARELLENAGIVRKRRARWGWWGAALAASAVGAFLWFRRGREEIY
jgi:phage gp46-like protein